MVTFRAPARATHVIALEAPLLRRSAAGKLARTMGIGEISTMTEFPSARDPSE